MKEAARRILEMLAVAFGCTLAGLLMLVVVALPIAFVGSMTGVLAAAAVWCFRLTARMLGTL